MTNRAEYGIIRQNETKGTDTMDILTFEEWYELVKDMFELVPNRYNPRDLYDEYVAEALG